MPTEPAVDDSKVMLDGHVPHMEEFAAEYCMLPHCRQKTFRHVYTYLCTYFHIHIYIYLQQTFQSFLSIRKISLQMCTSLLNFQRKKISLCIIWLYTCTRSGTHRCARCCSTSKWRKFSCSACPAVAGHRIVLEAPSFTLEIAQNSIKLLHLFESERAPPKQLVASILSPKHLVWRRKDHVVYISKKCCNAMRKTYNGTNSSVLVICPTHTGAKVHKG